MPQTKPLVHEAGILSRLVGLDSSTLTPAAADAILSLALSHADQDRVNALAAKARAGTLDLEEQAEVEAYSRVGSILGVLKSKARQSVRGRRRPEKKAE